MTDVSPHSDNPIRVALISAAGDLSALARTVPTFGHSPDPEMFRSRASTIRQLATTVDAIFKAIGSEGALHTHGEIPAEDYAQVCADAVYNLSLAERFDMMADKRRDERREFSR